MRTLRFAFPALAVGISLAACGGDEAASPPAASNAGSAGSAGVAGTSGSGGLGAAAGSAGAAAGQAGKAGQAGASGGLGGNAGAGGLAPGACTQASDCGALEVTPAGCAKAVCTAGVCLFEAVDGDADGHATKLCTPANPKLKIALGDDCDDTNKDVFPGAWDGPAIDGKPNRCADSVDQDCSGADGDGTGPKGESCTCIPGDIQTCEQDGSGKPITFPGGKPQGICKAGTRTCVVDGITKKAVFGPCIGAVGPAAKETCNGGIDDDCDGKADMEDSEPPENLSKWSYDADDDGFAPLNQIDARIEWCNDAKPTVCPKEIPKCDPKAWKLANLPGEDCDDTNDKIRPTAIEKCNGDGKDYDCNGTNNLPTSGQCACLPGDEVACSAPGFEYPVDAPSDAYPLQAPPTLAGVCKWGKKKCNAGGQWDACSGGVGRSSLDCGVKDVDRNCNGVIDASGDAGVSTDCTCTNGATRPCEGAPKGLCTTGTETCVGGAWNGVCVGAVGPKNEVCDGYDEDCDGTIDQGDTCIQTLDVDLGYQQFIGLGGHPRTFVYTPKLYLTAYATRTGSNVRVQMRGYAHDGQAVGYTEGDRTFGSNVDSARYDWAIDDGFILGSDRFPGFVGGDLGWQFAAQDLNGLGTARPWAGNNCQADGGSDKGVPFEVASTGGKTIWEGRWWGWSRKAGSPASADICTSGDAFEGGNNNSYLCGQANCSGFWYRTQAGKGIRIRLYPK